MSRILSIEQLQKKLDRHIAWRKKELADINSMVQAKNSPEREKCLVRCGITLLYAHWEGFIKEAADEYLTFVNSQKLTYKELAPNFIALGIKWKLNDAIQAKKVSLHKDLVTFFLSRMEERCTFVPEISTQSNLSSQVLKEIIATLGLDFSPYETKAILLDEKLLNNRNRISHGRYKIIETDEFMNLYHQIIELMDLFLNQIIDAALTEAYKRTSK